MASTQASHRSWYDHRALLVAIGVAGYALYRVYTAPNTLHRSNAVRHPRRSLSEVSTHAAEEIGPIFIYNQPDRGEPLGALMISDNTSNARPRTIRLRLGLDLMPSIEDLEHWHPSPEAAYLAILEHALFRSLAACIQLRTEPEIGVHLSLALDFGFSELWTMLHTRNRAELIARASVLPLLLNLVPFSTPLTDEIAHRMVRLFIADDLWRLPLSETSLDDEHAAVGTNNMPAETETDLEHATDGDGIRGLLYYIAEENAVRKANIHRGISCSGCHEFPILGVRYHCLNCADYDLCATCEAHAVHPKTHVFAKIKIPLSLLAQPPKPQKLWYAGDPRKVHPLLDTTMKKQLCTEFELQEEELDALYNRFTCIASVPWHDDPTGVAIAIDRRAFNKTMNSERWANKFAPNVLMDRMFAFYDTDCNSLIGFWEFISGMEYLRGKKRFASLRRALQGFDMDGDSFVTRADFVRLLRGKFEIQKRFIIDSTEVQETERTSSATDILRSSQPISSVFNREEIPSSGERRPHGKHTDENGDTVPVCAEATILDDEHPFSEAKSRPEHEELIATLDRFEDMLTGQVQAHASMMDGDDSTIAALQVLEAVRPPTTMVSKPYVQDLLWHYKEAGLNTLLDPLFARRDEAERRASSSRDTRKRWRAAIDQFRQTENITSDEELRAWTLHESTQKHLSGEIVPTDDKSLEQRELDTTRASLDSLLEISGYSIRDEVGDDDDDAPSPTDFAAGDMSLGGGGDPNTRAASTPHVQEMQLVQDDRAGAPSTAEFRSTSQMPSPPDASGASLDGATEEPPPPPETLHLWARLDQVDRDMSDRGGPGRLSLDEVESIIVEQNLLEVRGLVKSWLEWCAF